MSDKKKGKKEDRRLWKPTVGVSLFQRKSGRHKDRKKEANKKACRKGAKEEE